MTTRGVSTEGFGFRCSSIAYRIANICVVVCLKRYMKTTHPSPVVADGFTFAAHHSSEKQHSQHSCHPGKFVKCFMTVHIYMFFVFHMTIYICMCFVIHRYDDAAGKGGH